MNNLITYFCKMWFIIITHYQKTIKIYLKPKYVNVRAIKCLNIVYYYRPNILQDILFLLKKKKFEKKIILNVAKHANHVRVQSSKVINLKNCCCCNEIGWHCQNLLRIYTPNTILPSQCRIEFTVTFLSLFALFSRIIVYMISKYHNF